MAAPLFNGVSPHLAALLAAAQLSPARSSANRFSTCRTGEWCSSRWDTGQQISEHRAPFASTLHVLDGRLRFGVETTEPEMGPYDWLVMPADAPHHLTALESTRFLLTLFKGPC